MRPLSNNLHTVTVSPDALFCGITVDELLDSVQGVCDRPENCTPEVVRAAYRALVRIGFCTEAEAKVGVSEVLRTRAARMAA